MTDFLIAGCIAVGVLWISGLIWVVIKIFKEEGCKGDCQQGRFTCNCNRRFK